MRWKMIVEYVQHQIDGIYSENTQLIYVKMYVGDISTCTMSGSYLHYLCPLTRRVLFALKHGSSF